MADVDVTALVDEIEGVLAAQTDRRTDNLRRVRREYSQRLKGAAPEVMLELAQRLVDRGPWTLRWFGYELVHYHRPTLRSLDAATLEQLGAGMDDWPATDTFAPYLSGVAWREGQIDDDVIHRWAGSEDQWWRRTALVSTIALNNRARGGRGDTARTLAVCRLLAADDEDMVVKAMSWALRTLVHWDADAVRGFLDEHEEVLAARVRREVRNKLETGLKNP